ncbi:MAG: NUDIX hydrolase [Edaphocola sp.]
MIEIIEDKVLAHYHSPLHLVTFATDSEKKNTKKWEIYMRPNGAAVLPYNPQTGKVILVKQFRLPAYIRYENSNGHTLETCAGLIDKGETPEETIRREALEEIGYELKEIQFVSKALSTPGAVTEQVYLFVAPYDHNMKKQEGGGLANEGEDIEIIEMDYKEAYAAIADNKLYDMKTIILLQHLRLAGLM